MFQRFIAIARAHPLWIIGGVLVGIILIGMIWRGRGSAAQPQGTAYSLLGPDKDLAAINAQLTLAQNALSALGVQAASSERITENNNAATIALATLSNQTAQFQTTAQFGYLNNAAEIAGNVTTHAIDAQVQDNLNKGNVLMSLDARAADLKMQLASAESNRQFVLASMQRAVFNDAIGLQEHTLGAAMQVAQQITANAGSGGDVPPTGELLLQGMSK